MRRTKNYIYLSLLAIILFLPFYTEAPGAIAVRPISPSGREVSGSHWLFVIGIDTYIHWPRLNTAANDAKSLKDVLLSHYYFDKDHLIELYDEQATRKNILGKLRFLAKKVNQDDSVVIFYAGHGHLDSITKAGSWIPVESGTKDVSAWISNHDIKNYLRVDVIKAKHILLISDSCFSGDFFRGHRGRLPEVTDEVIKRAYKLTSRQAITSGGLEPVSDEGFGKNSIFSHFLVKTLRENQKPFLVPSDFFSDIKAGVAENAEQFPRFGSLKDTGGQQGGELVLFLKQESRLKDLSAEAAERKKELKRLRQMEAAAEEARKKEAKEIAKRQRELAELDAKIKKMRKRLGGPAVRADDNLDRMLAMVRQKEEQERKLKELQRKRREEEQKLRAEIQRLKEEQQKRFWKTFEENIRKYSEIANSQFGKDLKETAWKSLISRYPGGERLKMGDIDGLKLALKAVGRLSIKTEPKNALVEILNIKPKFKQGIELKAGIYQVAISDRGYITEKRRVSLAKGEDKKLKIRLKAKEVDRDPTFIAYSNGVVRDTKTGLEWVAGPNRSTSWNEARAWVRSLNINSGGWRMPTVNELRTLYQKGRGKYNMTHLLKVTSSRWVSGVWVWSGETKGASPAWGFNFEVGYGQKWIWANDSASFSRGFAVRSRSDG